MSFRILSLVLAFSSSITVSVSMSTGIASIGASIGCEDPPKPAPSQTASEAPPPPPPPREGCAKTGMLSAVESDPTCQSTARVSEDAMRLVMKHLSVNLVAEPSEIMTGGTALLGITITNTSKSEVTLFLEARTRTTGPRTDWSRVAGIPEPKVTATSDVPHLFFPLTTTDSYDHDVDALPMIPNSAPTAPPPITTLAVHLRAGGKLTHNVSWWALRIPAPAPIVQDDAGHRYIPKTSALPLMTGEYTIAVELPLFGLSREERKTTTRVRVVRATLPDGGLKKAPLY